VNVEQAVAIAENLTEARVYLEDATRELQDARPVAAGVNADHTVTEVDGLLADLAALKDRIYRLERDWLHRADPTRAA
jgi:hypothetical protein